MVRVQVFTIEEDEEDIRSWSPCACLAVRVHTQAHKEVGKKREDRGAAASDTNLHPGNPKPKQTEKGGGHVPMPLTVTLEKGLGKSRLAGSKSGIRSQLALPPVT